MNLLLSYYKEKYTDKKWRKKYTSAAQKVVMYKFKGTNGRYLTSYDNKFKKFCEVEGKPRSEWPTYSNGQLKHKQYPVSMIEARLFYRKDDIYYKTAKGEVYKNYLDLKIGKEEKWLINYILLLDSTIANRENYILNRSLEVQEMLFKYVNKEIVNNACIEFFKARNNINELADLAKYDYLYLNCFYLDEEFLKLFNKATILEREELKSYVYNNLKKGVAGCAISKKFISTNYSVPEIIDDVKIYYFSLLLNSIRYSNFDNTINEILDLYKKDYDYDLNSVKDFICDNKEIFEPVLINIFYVEEIEEIEDSELNIINEEILDSNIDVPEPRIDDTTIEGKQKLKRIFACRKKIAREKANYKCELEDYKDCRYFTSKTTNYNYVEVHHLIPREFRNNFENSIDVLANYITLCPHCHKMIHLAKDRERIDVVRYIYNQRKDRLCSCGIDIEFKELLEYYNIQEKN